ncbi:DUF5069 domain-containing protein [Candidatus Methylacidithermus pantelleriae]|uniref:DUF5069 domain-containing protein n=1 Tax=Candidatus Methylacidithermus pantelleriae TaxID=2744239 RepID=A0A8J2BLI5_9BACT|nr:DUF5069 domain-containing protein [Candidatus Methylacidithermus pantelleriae]CAF0699187.1 conserved hypothetical protein [Candidatus Methylacidithermus pantelleriae]
MAYPFVAPDLTKRPPRSPKVRLGGYVILPRTIDKCRALLAGTLGAYLFNCPLDQKFFQFKGLDPEAFREAVARSETDEAILHWVETHGIPRTPEEVQEWSRRMEEFRYGESPQEKEFFLEQCRKLGLDPETTRLFDLLEEDDRSSLLSEEGESCPLFS